MSYWHGGGRIAGDWVLPPEETGVSRSGDHGVHVTTDRDLAAAYASTTDGPTAWVYEVEPEGDLTPMPSLVDPDGPAISFRCARARIVRRLTVPNDLRRRYRAAILPYLMPGRR